MNESPGPSVPLHRALHPQLARGRGTFQRYTASNGTRARVQMTPAQTSMRNLLQIGILLLCILLCKVLSCLKDILTEMSTMVNYQGSMVDTLDTTCFTNWIMRWRSWRPWKIIPNHSWAGEKRPRHLRLVLTLMCLSLFLFLWNFGSHGY